MNALSHPLDPQYYGLLFLAIGILIRYLIGRRRFNRRGIGGLQQFASFEKAVVVSLLEWLFKWTAYALILLGIFMLINT